MKLIHCADLHLDSPMETHMTAAQASARNTEILKTFLRLTAYARENGVRAVLIAGDLFDGSRVKARTVDGVLDAMAQTPEVDYLYLPGNHDGAARAFSDRVLPPNLRQFSPEWTTFSYEDAAISGIQMTKDNAAALYDTLPTVEGTHIVTLHGQTGTACGVDQVNLNRLKDKGIDYLALGHLHAFALERLDARGMYCYSGCLEGRGFDECGEKGFVLLDIQGGRVSPTFVPFSARQLHRLPVGVTGLGKNAEVARAMAAAAQGISREDMVEFILTGHSDPGADLAVSYLQDLVKDDFFFAKVKDETRLALDPAAYENDVSLKGEFIRLVLAGEGTEADKAAVIRAGLEALAGEEIVL